MKTLPSRRFIASFTAVGIGAACALSIACAPSFAQTSGNIGYTDSGAKARAQSEEQRNRLLQPGQTGPSDGPVFVEASVLMNVKADEYVAVFAVASEGATVEEANDKMQTTLAAFAAALKPLGLSGYTVAIDFVSQNKIYGYEVTETLAKERLTGFEVKKNVSLRYKDKALLDRITNAAARSQIYDLVKVDYVVNDTASVKKRLRTEAARLIKEKIADDDTLLGVKLAPPSQIYVDKISVYYPSQLYDAYTAAEGENVDRGFDRSRVTVQTARKTRTFFFNPLDADGFDTAINPVIIEPVVQFTLYVKVKCDVKKAPPTP